RRAHDERECDPETESAADQQNRSRAPFRQIADHDGPGRRQVFLQRHNARNEFSEPRKPGSRRGKRWKTIKPVLISQFSVLSENADSGIFLRTENWELRTFL